MQIFISYKREEKVFAKQLHIAISDWGFNSWLDFLAILPGEDWDTAVHNGLKASQIVVGILTPESLASKNVLNEWGYALSTDKRLFLLWLRDVPEADIPPRYIRIQRIDIRTSQPEGMQLLRQALESSAKVAPVTEIETTKTQNLLVSSQEDMPESASRLQAGFQETATQTSKVPSAQSRTNRERMLEKVKVFWIKGVLEQSVYGAALIELGIQSKQGIVDNPWDKILQHNVYGDYRLPVGTKIGDVYRDLNGALLILGDPGSGKTTTTLELARDMIALAETDEKQPIPVVFNLSSWADERKPLAAWLVDELNTKYQVPRKVANDWVDTDALLLLLDGLDEVDARYRDACVTAINTFRAEHGFTSMVVCSRIADYEALSNRLKLNGAIVLQPLEGEQIDHYLRQLGPQLQGVRDAMALDSDLRKLAESPLMLSIMTLAFRGVSAADLPPLASVEAQRSRLFETYTKRMFERRPSRWYKPEQTLHYLKWLGARMVERKQSVFYIENLQIDWIAGDHARRLYRIAGRTTFGLLGGLVVGALALLAFLLLILLLGGTLPSYLTALTLLFLSIPSGFGGLIFVIAGMQAYALDSIPASFRPLRPFARRFGAVIGVATLLGLLSALLGLLVSWITLLLTGTGLDVANVTYYGTYDTPPLEGWAALGYWLMLFFTFGGALGALTGAATASVATAINIVQTRRRLVLGAIQLGLLALAISLASSVVIMILDFLLRRSVSYSIAPATFLYINLTAVLIGLMMALIVRMTPVRIRVLPYVLLASMPAFSVFVLVLILNLSHSYYYWTSVVASLIIVLIFAAMGLLVGKITDKIESAESLRWAWSWRWSLVGTAGMVALGFFLASTTISYATSYTPEREQDYTQRYITPNRQAIQELQSQLVSLQTEWNQNSTQWSDFDMLADLITRRVILENQIRYYTNPDYGTQWDDLDSYYYNTINYYYSSVPSFAYYYSDPQLLQNQLVDIENQLSSYPLSTEEMQDLSDIRYGILRREELIDELEDDVQYVRQHYTRDGLNKWFASNVRVTLALGLSLIIAGGVAGGLHKTETVDIRTRPNSGIRRTFYTALRVMFAFGMVGVLVGGLIGGLLTGFSDDEIWIAQDVREVIIPFAMIIGMAFGLSLGLIMGGSDAVVKHFILRGFLQRSRSIPRNYARFLDYSADCILLRKVGGGYIFIHRFLLEYFASLENSASDT